MTDEKKPGPVTDALDLDRLWELWNEASPGRWVAREYVGEPGTYMVCQVLCTEEGQWYTRVAPWVADELTKGDAESIAELHTQFPAVLDHIRTKDLIHNNLMRDLEKVITSLDEQADGIGTFDDGHEWLCYARKLIQQAYVRAVEGAGL